MKYEIAEKFLAVRREGTIRADFPVKFEARKRQVSVNRKPSPLLAMKYAIGGIFFLVVWVGNEFAPCPQCLVPQRKAPAVLAMRDAIGKNCFHVLRTRALAWWAAREGRKDPSQARSEGP